MAKTGEYKYRIFTGDSRCVKAGGREQWIKAEMNGGCDRKDEVVTTQEYIESVIKETLDRREAELLTSIPGGDFHTPKTPSDDEEFPADGSPVDTKGEPWPASIVCHDKECNSIVPRKESKYDTPYYYKCPKCGKNSWPKWYLEKKFNKGR